MANRHISWSRHNGRGENGRILEVIVPKMHFDRANPFRTREFVEGQRTWVSALPRCENYRRLPGERDERRRIVGKDERVAAGGVHEEVEDAFVCEDAVKEVDFALAVLAEKFARQIRLPQAPLDRFVDSGLPEEGLYDVDGARVLKDSRALPMLESRQGRP